MDVKDLQLLTWLTQLGLSTAVPLAGFVLLGVWLRNRFDLGLWVLFMGIGLGLLFAIDGFCRSLKILSQMSKNKGKKPPVSYGEHD